MKFLILNGPNINMIQYEEPGHPGVMDYDALVEYIHLCCEKMGCEAEFYQSNHEGDLIDEIQAAPGRVDGIVINPGGYAQSGVAMLDALRMTNLPVVEVMLDDLREKEPFRKSDVVALACQGQFFGEGSAGYAHACAFLAQLVRLDVRPGGPRITM